MITALALALAVAAPALDAPAAGATVCAPTAAAPAPLPPAARPDATTAFYVVVRPGAMVPFLRSTGNYRGFDGEGSGGWTLSIAAGRWLDEHFGLEFESGYQPAGSADGLMFGVSHYGSTSADATLEMALATTSVNVRVRGPASSARPYLLVGGGVAHLDVDIAEPSWLSQREHALTAYGQVGAGFELDLGGRFFAGVELRCFATPDVELGNEAHGTGGTLGVVGAGGSVLVGARL